MKRIAAILMMLGFALQVHAQQEVKLVDTPPLEPLRNCRHSDGTYVAQNAPCSADTTEVGLLRERKPDGSEDYMSLEKQKALVAGQPGENHPEGKPEPAVKISPEESKEIMKDFRVHMMKFLGFALVVAVIAKLLKRSFVLWFILGFVLRMVLVAANVIAF